MKANFKTFIKILVLLAIITVASVNIASAQIGSGTAPVIVPSGGFRIEGDLLSNSPTTGIGDWAAGPAGSGGYLFCNNGNPFYSSSTFHFIYLYNYNHDIIFT